MNQQAFAEIHHQFVADFFFGDALKLVWRAVLKNGAGFTLR